MKILPCKIAGEDYDNILIINYMHITTYKAVL